MAYPWIKGQPMTRCSVDQSKHTPGPLLVTGPHRSGYHICVRGVKHTAFNIPIKADADLYAAAPDLLEALEEALRYIDKLSHFSELDRAATLVVGEDAIRRARGDS